jgi:hypothetical protein
MEQTTIFLSVQFDACVESHEQYPYYEYCTEYGKVLYEEEEKDITGLVKQYPDVEFAIWEELQREYPRTGRNLHTDFWLDVPVAFVKAIEADYKAQ